MLNLRSRDRHERRSRRRLRRAASSKSDLLVPYEGGSEPSVKWSRRRENLSGAIIRARRVHDRDSVRTRRAHPPMRGEAASMRRLMRRKRPGPRARSAVLFGHYASRHRDRVQRYLTKQAAIGTYRAGRYEAVLSREHFESRPEIDRTVEFRRRISSRPRRGRIRSRTLDKPRNRRARQRRYASRSSLNPNSAGRERARRPSRRRQDHGIASGVYEGGARDQGDGANRDRRGPGTITVSSDRQSRPGMVTGPQIARRVDVPMARIQSSTGKRRN